MRSFGNSVGFSVVMTSTLYMLDAVDRTTRLRRGVARRLTNSVAAAFYAVDSEHDSAHPPDNTFRGLTRVLKLARDETAVSSVRHGD